MGSEAFGALSLLTRMPAAALSFLARSPLTDWGTHLGGQGKRKHRVYLMALLSVMVMTVPFVEHVLNARTLPGFHASSYLGFTMIL